MSSLKCRNVIRSIFFVCSLAPYCIASSSPPILFSDLDTSLTPSPIHHPSSPAPSYTHTHTFRFFDNTKSSLPTAPKTEKKLFRFGIFVKNNLLTPSRSPTPILPKPCFSDLNSLSIYPKYTYPLRQSPPALPPQPHPTQKIIFRFGFFVKKKQTLFSDSIRGQFKKKIIPAQKKKGKKAFLIWNLCRKN